MITHYPFKVANLAIAKDLAAVIECFNSQYSPFDCHCDIDQSVAFLMGYYESQSAQSHCMAESCLDFAIQDLRAILEAIDKKEQHE